MACSPTPGLPYRCQQSTVPNTYICCMEGARADANKDRTKIQMTTPRLPIMDNTTMIQIEDPNAWRWDNEDTDKDNNNKPNDDDDDDDWVVWNGEP